MTDPRPAAARLAAPMPSGAEWSLDIGVWPESGEPLVVVTAPVGSFGSCQRRSPGAGRTGRRGQGPSLSAVRRADLRFLQNTFGLRAWDTPGALMIPVVRWPAVTIAEPDTVVVSIADTPWVQARLDHAERALLAGLTQCFVGVVLAARGEPRGIEAFAVQVLEGMALIGDAAVTTLPVLRAADTPPGGAH